MGVVLEEDESACGDPEEDGSPLEADPMKVVQERGLVMLFVL